MCPTNWTTCWPFLLSIIIKLLFLPSWCPLDVTANILKNKPSAPWLSDLSALLKTHTDIYGVPAHLLLNIHEEADRPNPSATLTFTRKEQALKTCGEVSWRSWGEPWSIEGSLISLPTTQDTVVSFDTPDSKGDLLTARLQSRRNKQFIERACIHTAAVRLEKWQLLMWSNAAIMSDTSLLGRKSNKSQTRIHWCPPKSNFQDALQGRTCQIPDPKGKDYAVINIYVSSFCYWQDISVSISPGWKQIKD